MKKIKFSLIFLILILIFSLSGCKSEEEEEVQEIDESIYAKNEVKDRNSSSDVVSSDDEEEYNIEIDSTPTPTSSPEEDEHTLKYLYDPSILGSTLTKFDTIVIDDKLVEFPCDYSYLLDKFGELYFYESPVGKWPEKYTEVDEEYKDSTITVRAIPKTGVGTIEFVFYSDDFKSEGTIKELTCKEVNLSGGSYDPLEKTMVVALPKGLSFGYTIPEVTTLYGTPDKKLSSNVRSFVYKYKSHSSTEYELVLSGTDKGVSNISIKYFKTSK